MRHLFTTFFLLAAALTILPVARAATVLPISDAALVDRSDLVVRAEVVAGSVSDDTRDGIVTDTELRVVETLLGTAGATVVVRSPGGILPSGEGRIVPGAPQFARGDEVLLFLAAGDAGTHRVTGWNQGVFHELAGAAGPVYVRPYVAASGLAASGPVKGAAEDDRPRDRAGFLDWIRGRRDGETRPDDYLLAPTAAPAATAEKFRLLGGRGPVFRWFEFDEGEAVVWLRHADAPREMPDGGVEELRRALEVLNDEPHTPIRLVDGGTTTVFTGGGSHPPDGNTVHYSAGQRLFAGSCLATGLAAVADVRIVRDEGETWRGLPALDIVEAEIYINNGLPACFGLNYRPRRLTGLFLHELGHTLGLHHPCTERSPCSPRERESVMSGSGNWRGETLPVDDVEGLRFLYDASLEEAELCANRGGDVDFCTACAPCGHGEGDCDRDADCDLLKRGVCATDAGPEFGFRPAIDVCKEADPCPIPPGSPGHCAACGPCAAGGGDCRGVADCRPGLVCREDLGRFFGYAPEIGVCVHERNAPPNDCGAGFGHPDFCDVCAPCFLGEGDCDRDTDCAGDAVCGDDLGALFGFRPDTDVCVVPDGDGGGDDGGDDGDDGDDDAACALPPGHGDYCRDCGPCADGEGDCDRDTDCTTSLECVQDVGAEHGFGPGIDVCVAAADPACPWPPGHGHYCRDCGPCAAAQGDCDRDADCTGGLTCVQDVGAEHGFGPGIDVCRCAPRRTTCPDLSPPSPLSSSPPSPPS